MMQTLIDALSAHVTEIVSALVALFLLYARALVLSRIAAFGVTEAETLALTKPMKHERVVASLRRLPLGVRPVLQSSADKLVVAAHTKVKKARSAPKP
jgi:hypothetical protein